jgi:hypothetical protein
MEFAYYARNLPIYIKQLHEGNITLNKWGAIITELQDDCRTYAVNVISAYNLPFDIGAITVTQEYLSKLNGDFSAKTIADILPKDIELWDIWTIATDTIYNQTFADWAIINDYLTESYYIKTGAEIGYRYITSQRDFVESHTAVEDCDIELEILKQCLLQELPSVKVRYNPWYTTQQYRSKELELLSKAHIKQSKIKNKERKLQKEIEQANEELRKAQQYETEQAELNAERGNNQAYEIITSWD